MAYQYITNRDSPNYTSAAETPRWYGYNRTIEGITIHWWGDPNNNPSFEGIVNYLCRDGGNTSAHYVATGTNRRVACIVAPQDTAWHSGSTYGNAKTIGIECDPRARDEDYDVIAELIADIRSAFGDVPIYSHNMWTATQCPGVYDIERLDKLSYTKVSHDDWGAVTNANTPPPVTVPSQPAPTAPPTTLLFKVLKGGKQIGAFAKDINAWNCYQSNSADKITANGADVTASLKAKFLAPSPTSVGDLNTGVPVADKTDYEELKKRVSKLEATQKAVVDFLTNMFKGFKP